MKSIILISCLLALFAIVFPIALSSGNPIEADESTEISEQSDLISNASAVLDEQASRSDENTIIRLKRGDAIVELNMSEYLKGVVGAEMPANFEIEALKAQAVAARTYTMYKMQINPSSNHPDADVCNDSACCKAYKDDKELKEKWGVSYAAYNDKIKNVVKATDGEYLTYENEPILAVFHSSSTGKTESCENVWGGSLPYLISVDSRENTESIPRYKSVVTISADIFRETIRTKYPEADFSNDQSSWITELAYSDSGRLLTACIGNVTVTGKELRTLFDLRSTGMKISINDDEVVFTVTGYGHGVGMSQYGANAMAWEGSTYDEILAWYYTGTTLVSVE